MSGIKEKLRALVILDEVGSNNPLGREAADEVERLEALAQERLDGLLAAASFAVMLMKEVQRLREDGKQQDTP